MKRLVLAAAWSLAACAAPTSAPTVSQTGSAPAGTFSSGLATVPVGIVMSFQVSYQSATPVTASVDDPTVAVVAPATGDGQFVVIGTSEGQTTVHFFVDGRDARDIAVAVTPRAP